MEQRQAPTLTEAQKEKIEEVIGCNYEEFMQKPYSEVFLTIGRWVKKGKITWKQFVWLEKHKKQHDKKPKSKQEQDVIDMFT